MCGGGGVANQCGCTPTPCSAKGATCGSIPDGCGGTLACGACNAPLTCGGGAAGANVCGCTPESDADLCKALGATCGSLTASDNCGASRAVASCGVCAYPETCGGGGAPNVCAAYAEAMEPICSPDGWCWDNPRPQGNDLQGAITTPSGNQWVCGMSGTVLHWDGAAWRGWTGLAQADFYAIWAASDDDLWVGGSGGVLLHYDGKSFTAVTSPVTERITGLWGASSSQIWATGQGGDVLAYDGKSWAKQASFASTGLYAIAGTSASDLWAVGVGPVVHYDGHAWTATTVSGSYQSVWAASPTSAWAVGGSGLLRWDGVAWNTASGATGNVVHGRSASDVWVLGSPQGSAWHWDGLAWTAVPVDQPNWEEFFSAVTSDASGRMLAVGSDGILYRWVNGAWSRLWTGATSETPVRVQLSAGVAASPTDVFGAGFDYARDAFSPGVAAVFARHASGVSTATSTSAADGFFAISASSPSDVWAVGRQDIDHWDGTTWTETVALDGEADLCAVVALSPSDVWVAGDDKTQHWDGAKWTEVPNPVSGTSVQFLSLAGSEGGDLWAGAGNGTLLRYAGGAWSAVKSPGTGSITSLTSPASGFALACESGVGLIGWNGSSFSATGPTGTCLFVRAASPADAWAMIAGSAGATQLWHFDGANWAQSAMAAFGQVVPVAVMPTSGKIWALGSGGQTLSHP